MKKHLAAPGNSLDKSESKDKEKKGKKNNETVIIPKGTNFNEPEEKKVWTGEELVNLNVKTIPCLLEPLFPQVGLSCLAGSSDTGKSTLLRQFAVAVITGQQEFLGFKINATHHKAIIVSTEDDPTAISYLLNRKEYEPGKMAGLRFLFDSMELITLLNSELTKEPADLLIIDCFADAYGNDLKDTNKIRNYLHPMHQLALKHRCSVVFIHHTAKRTEEREPSKNNLLSGQGFEAKTRLVMELRTDATNPNHRHLCIVKANYLPPEFKNESYILEFDREAFEFRNTGERTPFESLAKSDDGGKAKYEQAKELQKQGHTLEQIAPMMGYANKSGVSKLISRFEKKVS